MSGATIFKEGDNSAGFASTLTANNYCTGSAGTKHHDTHSPIEKASNGEKCTQGSDGKRTYRWIKKPHAQVTIPNAIPTQSRRSRFSLDNPEMHSCYWKSTSESSLTNLYGTRRNRNRLVVCRATTYKMGMTVPESKSTPTASNHRTGSAGRKHLGEHLPAKNRSWRLVNKRTWRIVNQCTCRWNDDVDTQTSDSEHTWRWSGKHTRRNTGEHNQQLEMISAPSTGRMLSVPTSAPTWRMISATARAPEKWWEDQVSLIYAERLQLCLPKQFRTRPKMISECTE